MIRTLTTFWLICSLLVPSGICVCHLAASSNSPIDLVGTDDPASGDHHDEHDPNCPVVAPANDRLLAQQVTPETDRANAATFVAVRPEPPTACAGVVGVIPAPRRPHAPLYLTLRTILI